MRATYAFVMVMRARLVSLHESSRAVISTGCTVGVIAGAFAAATAVAAIDPNDIGFLDSMTENAVMIGILLITGVVFGGVCGFAVGGVESAASFAIALMAANRRLSCRGTFIVLAFIYTAINVSLVSIASVVMLGTDGTGAVDYVGPAEVALATLVTTAIFGWAHSLDWPEQIDLRDQVAPRTERSDETVRHEEFVDALQSRLHD